MAWLLDAGPPEWRQLDALRRHPIALAHKAALYVQGAVEAARTGYRQATRELTHHLPPDAIHAVLDAYRIEGPRLIALAQSIEVVEQALRGHPFTPTLRGGGRTGAGPPPPSAA
ncbi:hypothetical protein AB0J71_46500 [Nonomuraea sp. NPDC049637]|uniref:hypothetical protein n=1 Tax=Nonomuraea sp. NPDC049637 TaxID=3154356 RepID=UPI003418D465